MVLYQPITASLPLGAEQFSLGEMMERIIGKKQPFKRTGTRHHGFIDKAKQIGVGLALSAIALGGSALVAEGSVSLTKDIAITTSHAEPSNMLADGFTLLEDAGAVVGTIALAKRGARHFKLAFNEEAVALDEVAHSSSRSKTIARVKVPRVIAAAGLLTSFTGIVAGNFFNIADNVAKTQSNVAHLFNDVFPHNNSPTFIISNNPTPNMLNTSAINTGAVNNLESAAKADDVQVVPIHHDWVGGAYKSSTPNSYNLEFLTIGLPQVLTGIPRANAKCSNVEVNASSALGVTPGHTFELQGLRVTVHDLIEGDAGFNLLPVVVNNSDYENCFLTNADSSYSMAIAQGSRIDVDRIVNSINDSNSDPAKRLYVVSTEDFINNAENTGKNAVNGLVLEAMAIGMALGAIALNYRTNQDLANNRSRNRMLKANGYDEHMIMRIYKERAEADAIASAVIAMPGTLLIDTLVNHAQPGGALGVNLETYAAVTGFLWVINRFSTARAVRRESRIMSNERNL